MKSKRTICFLLMPSCHLMDLAGPAQVFYEASQLGNEEYNIVFAGIDRDVKTEQNLLMSQLTHFRNVRLQPGDYVFVPGIHFKAFLNGDLDNDILKVKPWLRDQAARNISIASVCSGSLILAEAGLLEGRKCTSHWKCIEYMQKQYPKSIVEINKLYVADGNIFTSAGMTSGIDMALSILEMIHGPILPSKVAREMVVYIRRNDDDPQEAVYLDYRTHFNPGIHKVQDYIISNPKENPGLEELAALGNTSVRNLTRMFRKATGHSIIDYKNTTKLNLAETLVGNSNYTIDRIAMECGFTSARHLRRIWKTYKGGTLSTHRATIMNEAK
jgi:transcriptional regulator GlxA family with amidase domain